MKLSSDFLLLDVKNGRKKLYDYFLKRKKSKSSLGDIPVNKPIPVIIEGYIVDFWGADDGISREFEVKVKKSQGKH